MDPLAGNNFGEKSKERLIILGSFKEEDDDDESTASTCLCYNLIRKKINRFWRDSLDFAGKAWEMGRSDPRKIIFAFKMGLSLSLVSLLIFWKDSYHNIDQYVIWAILTVIVMFEFSIGM